MARSVFTRISAVLVVVSATALVACGGSDSKTATPAAIPTVATMTTAAPGDTGSVGAGKSLRSADNRLEVRGGGHTPLDVTLKVLPQPPAPPAGWTLLAPVYEITARDHDRAVTTLTDPFELRFNVGNDPATVVYYDDSAKAWVIVESDVVAGVVIATTDHLTPYTVAKPSGPGARPTVTAPSKPAAPGSITPGANVSATAGTVTADAAQRALEAAASQYKGRQVKVSGAAGYTGSGVITLPASLDAALNAVSGTAGFVYGLYNGVNEAITALAGGTATSGSLVVLVEPKTTMPTSNSDASAQLAKLFPGAVGPKYSPAGTGSATNYAFIAQTAESAYAMGYVSYNGLSLAYLVVGSGSYNGVPAAAAKP